MNINEYLRRTVAAGASDLHFCCGKPATIRVHGDLTSLDDLPLSAVDLQAAIAEILDDSQQAALKKDLELDSSYEIESVARFRVNIFTQNEGPGISFRVIPSEVQTLAELGLPPMLTDLCNLERGLVLFTGPTGSGKTTTQAAMLDHINAHQPRHIITIEDPIEFTHTSKQCLINQRELGCHTHTFANALRAALREDPDVILVGEMRDLETIRLALTAAETGHLVFATLHSQGAVATVDRIIDVFPADQQQQIRTQLADTIEGILTQILCKRADEGRVAAFEIMIATPAVRNLIREGKTHQIPAMMQSGKCEGMQLMEMAVNELVECGVVTHEEARRRLMARNRFTLLSNEHRRAA